MGDDPDQSDSTTPSPLELGVLKVCGGCMNREQLPRNRLEEMLERRGIKLAYAVCYDVCTRGKVQIEEIPPGDTHGERNEISSTTVPYLGRLLHDKY